MTSPVPSRRATRAQSAATFPPPSTHDPLAQFNFLAEIDSSQKIGTDQHAVSPGPRYPELHPAVRADGDEHGVVSRVKQRVEVLDCRICFDFDAQLRDITGSPLQRTARGSRYSGTP